MKRYGRKWQRIRAAILKRDKYRSQLAYRYGRIIQADTVHHILPVEYFPEFMYAPWNLISITMKEHNELHVRSTHQLTDKGLALAERTARNRGMDWNVIKERLTERIEEP